MIPTTTGFKEAVVWKGFDNPKVKGGRIMDLECIRGRDGSLYSRWKAESWRERLRFLFTGRLWIGVMAERLPPVSCVIGPKL